MTDQLEPAPTAEQMLRNLSRDVFPADPAEGSVDFYVQYLSRACRMTDAVLKAYARDAAREVAGTAPPSWTDSSDYLRRALEYADFIAIQAQSIRSCLAEQGGVDVVRSAPVGE